MMGEPPLDVTAILAQPREAARRIEELKSKLAKANETIDHLASELQSAHVVHDGLRKALAAAEFAAQEAGRLLTATLSERDAARIKSERYLEWYRTASSERTEIRMREIVRSYAARAVAMWARILAAHPGDLAEARLRFGVWLDCHHLNEPVEDIP